MEGEEADLAALMEGATVSAVGHYSSYFIKQINLVKNKQIY